MRKNLTTETIWNLQLFADGDDSTGNDSPDTDTQTDSDNTDTDAGDDDTNDSPKDEKKYSDADLDKIIESKLAKWKKQQDKKVSEAEKLAGRNAEKKSEERIKDLEDKLNKYEREQAHTQMMTQARGILRDEHIAVSDNLLTSLVTDEADSTEENIKEFVKLFRDEVAKAVKEQLKGNTPKKGDSNAKLTKEEIEKVTNPIERQKLIRENINLWRK